jgi:hypothetical protein
MNTLCHKNKVIAAFSVVTLAGSVTLVSGVASAATWSDASVHAAYGPKFAEPGYSQDIGKNILGFTYAGGDSFGVNFFNMDVLKSNASDPEACASGAGTPSCTAAGAQEVYAVYRRTYSYTQVSGKKLGWGFINDIKLAFGVDLSSKNTTFAPRVRKFRIGPMVGLDVPGFAEIGIELYKENNHNGFSPYPQGGDVTFDNTYVLAADWGIPFAGGSFMWGGYFDYIGAKGYGTDPETLLDTEVMYDLGRAAFSTPKKLWIGLEYQYWHNKFGNPASAMPGTKESTPMIRMEYHF